MASSVERLLALKKEIEAAKIDKAQTEGAIKQNMGRLKDEFGVRTLETARKKLERLKEEREIIEGEINNAVQHLEENYEW